MALVYLTSTASEEVARYSRRDYERLVRFYESDRIRKHVLTDSPTGADIVIFVGSSGPSYRDVRANRIYRAHGEKCVLFESGDRCIPLLPGVYAGLQKKWARFSCGAALGGFYIRVAENTSMEIDYPIESSDYLFSFLGNVTNHAVRSRIMRLEHPRAFIRDSSADPVQQADGAGDNNRDRGNVFRDVMARSKFVLCPRGIGVSSWRLFETMRAGRVPVVISDDWLPPLGPTWRDFCLVIEERAIETIPDVLESRERDAPALAHKARAEWLKYYEETVIFNTVVETGLLALASFRERKKGVYAMRRLQYLTPFFARHWLVSPWVRRHLKPRG